MARSGRWAALAGRWWPELCIVVAWWLAFGPVVTGSAHIPYDAEFFHYPLLRAVQQDLAAGHLPAWDPYSYGGMPLLSNAQSAWLYPPHLILDGVLALAGTPWTERAQDILEVLHLLAAGLLTGVLVRRRGLGGAAVAFAGVFVVCSGLVLSQMEEQGMIEALPWLALGLIMVDLLAERVTPARVAGLGVTMAVTITTGFLPTALSACVMLVAAAILRPEGRSRALAGCLAGLVTAGLLAAAYLLPIAELAGVYPLEPMHGGLPTNGLLTTILPTVFGHWKPSIFQYHGPGGPTASYYYMGGASVVLAPLALLSRRRAWWDAALVGVLLVLSFGAAATWVVSHLQIGAAARLWRPEDFVFVAVVPTAALLARGLSRVPTVRAVAVAAAFVVLLVILPFPGPHGTVHFLLDTPVQTGVACLGCLVLVAAAAWLGSGRRAPRFGPRAAVWLLAGASLVAVADLALAAPSRYFAASPGPDTTAGPHSSGDGAPVIGFLDSHVAPTDRIMANIAVMGPAWAGFAPVWQISDANGFQPQFSRYQVQRVLRLEPTWTPDSRIFPIHRKMLPYLEEMDARWVVIQYPPRSPLAGAPGYRRVFDKDGYLVLRLTAPTQRAYGVNPGCAAAHPFDLLSCRSGGLVRTTLDGQSSRTYELTGRAPGELVTGEVWYPGWSATTTGGRSLSVRRRGYLAAVNVPPGTRRIRLSYDPPGLVLGAILSGLTLLVCAGFGVASLRRPGGAQRTIV